MEQQDVNNGGGNEKSMSEIIFPAIEVVRVNLKAKHIDLYMNLQRVTITTAVFLS